MKIIIVIQILFSFFAFSNNECSEVRALEIYRKTQKMFLKGLLPKVELSKSKVYLLETQLCKGV